MPCFRHRFVATAATAALVGGLAVVAAPFASAASGVSFCFLWAENGTDGVDRANKPYAGEPVRLIQVVDGRKKILRAGRTGSNGCGVFQNTPHQGRLFVRAVTSVAHGATGGSAVDFYAGRTRTTGPGDHRADLGTGKVKLRGSISAASRERGVEFGATS